MFALLLVLALLLLVLRCCLWCEIVLDPIEIVARLCHDYMELPTEMLMMLLMLLTLLCTLLLLMMLLLIFCCQCCCYLDRLSE